MFSDCGLRLIGLLGSFWYDDDKPTRPVDTVRQDIDTLGILDAGHGIIVCHTVYMAFERILTLWPNHSPEPTAVDAGSSASRPASRVGVG